MTNLNPSYRNDANSIVNAKHRNSSLSPADIDALKSGDQKAFDTAFHTMYPRVKAFIKILVKSDDTAQELSQKLFIDLWLKRERLDSSRNFNAYIYTMARNAALNYLKSKDFRDFYSYEYLNDEDCTEFDGDIYAKELDLLVTLTVNRMPLQRKRVYELSRNSNKSNDIIAEELNISKKAVEKHLRLALNDIREVIKRFTMLFFC